MRNYIQGSFQRAVADPKPTCSGCETNVVNGTKFDDDCTFTLSMTSKCQTTGTPEECPEYVESFSDELILTFDGISGDTATFTKTVGPLTATVTYGPTTNPSIYRWTWAIPLAWIPGYDSENPPLYSPCDGTTWSYSTEGTTHTADGVVVNTSQIKPSDPLNPTTLCEDPTCALGFMSIDGTLNTCCEQDDEASTGFRQFIALCNNGTG